MDIGIGLPATIPGTKGSLVLDWAKRADSGPFSSLGVLDRVVYPNHEPLVTLATAAAVTQRVRLIITQAAKTARGQIACATSWSPLKEHLDLRLLARHGGEADLRGVVSTFRKNGLPRTPYLRS